MKHLTSQGYYELTASIKKLEDKLKMSESNNKKLSNQNDELRDELGFYKLAERETARSLNNKVYS